MAYIPYILDQSLRYAVNMGYVDGIPTVFPLAVADWQKYISAEQAFALEVSGLKSGTVHRVYLNGIDVTSMCKQEGRNLGEGLLTWSRPYWRPGTAKFVFYYRAAIIPTTPVERAAAMASLIAGRNVLTVASVDGSSVATVNISLPRYAFEEPNIIVKKTPDPMGVASKVSYTEVKSASMEGPYFTPPSFSMIQTFYADPEVVNKSGEVNLTSVDIFFKRKPSTTNNASGNPNAGVAIAICEVENDTPNLTKTYSKSVSYKDYSMIYSFADASTPTTFGFKEPLKLSTGKFYGIVVMLEDPGYEIWVNKTGDRLVGTNVPSPGVNSNKDGKLFYRNNSGVYNSMSDTDIKFNVRVAKYIAQNDKKIFVNKNYEFFTTANTSGTFLGGEYVYQSKATSTGIVNLVKGANTISGQSTSFDTFPVGREIVLLDGSNTQIVSITEIINSTSIAVNSLVKLSNTTGSFIADTVVGQVYKNDPVNNKLYLNNSTANVAYFTVGGVVIGTDSKAQTTIASVDNITIDRVKIRGNVRVPAAGAIDTTLKSSALVGGNYVFNESNSERVKINNGTVHNLTNFDAYILSRSNEVLNNSLYSNTELFINNKSLKVEADYTVLGEGAIYQSPILEDSTLDLYSIQNKVSNTSSHIVGGIDTEVNGNGNATSKHITTKVTFSNGRFAEDIRMFMVAYRPLGTDIKVYARVHNSKDPEAFDDKSWSPLEYSTNGNRYSSLQDENDFVEYELGLPQFTEAANTLPGTFVTAFGSDTIVPANTTIMTPSSWLATDDVIRIYNPLFSVDSYQVATVETANATHIVIGGTVETNNIAGTGMVIEKLKYPNVAFNNINNSNVARYFNSRRAEFDTFDSMQVKIVFLADNTYKVPRIDKIEVIGVSA